MSGFWSCSIPNRDAGGWELPLHQYTIRWQNISSNVRLTIDVEINPLNTILYVKNGDITVHAQCQLWCMCSYYIIIVNIN